METTNINTHTAATNPTEENLTHPNPSFENDIAKAVSPSNVPQASTNTLTLLAERPQVDIERVATGRGKLSKKVVNQTVQVPITLSQEILVIEHDFAREPLPEGVQIHQSDSAPMQITINGETVTLTDEPLEITLSQQVAAVHINTVVAQTVQLSTRAVEHTRQIPINLRHETLVTEEVTFDNPRVISRHTMPVDTDNSSNL